MNEKPKTRWTINALLAVILALLLGYYFQSPAQKAHAAGGGWDTDGIMALSTAADNERIVLVDSKKQNIMVYKQQGNKFRLVGARSFKYDVEIPDAEGDKLGNDATFLKVWGAWQNRQP